MSKRDKILALVVVLLFGSAGYVLYSGLLSDQISIVTNTAPDTEANKKTIVNLLPFGASLDLQQLRTRNQKLQISPTNLYTYPSVNSADVGVPVDQLLNNSNQ